MLDRELIERAAGAIPVFSGGTSLSKGWGLIKRFSEDIDFKVSMAAGASSAQQRKQRSSYREQVLSALAAADFDWSLFSSTVPIKSIKRELI